MNFTRETIIEAIKKIDKNPKLRDKRTSSTYDLLYNNVAYPPILVLSEANKINGGEELLLADFNNSIVEPFRILRENGFEINKKTMSLKQEFEVWLKNKHKEKSGAVSSYIRSIELLSVMFYDNKKIATKDLFTVSDLEILKFLYQEVLKNQKNKDSYLYYSKAPGYGDNNFFSASLKNYIDFITSKNIQKPTSILNEFESSIKHSSLHFSQSLILRFIASLTAKPFVILSGLSGSGKTKIAQSFVQWICENELQYKIVPVGADWTNREPLVGYPNGLNPDEYITPDSGVLHLLLEAVKEENENKPYFLILDEMNLSHVERYFADFLSIMESDDTIKLYTGSKRTALPNLSIPAEITWPKNVFIIGTVNIDETTYMFSPKVLDRANVIEFRITAEEISNYFANPGVPDLDKLKRQGVGMSESFITISRDKSIAQNENISEELVFFFNQLKNVGAEFGYRSATEILQLVSKLKILEPSITDAACLDIAVMQKLLPKLHGSRSKLVKILVALGEICLSDRKDAQTKYFDSVQLENYSADSNVKYPISFEKLIRMYKNVLANGFTSYAEA